MGTGPKGTPPPAGEQVFSFSAPAEWVRELKSVAARRGTSGKRLIVAAVDAYLATKAEAIDEN